jgi:hypothetical protein
MHVTNRARVMPHTTVSRHVAIACGAPRVHTLALDFHVQSVIEISGAKRVSRTTNRVPRIRNLFARERDVARPVERY